MPSTARAEVRDASPAVRRRDHSTQSTESAVSGHPLLKLQRQVGNAQIARLMAHREAVNPDDEQVMAMHIDRDADGASAMPEVGMEGGQISDSLSQRIESKRGGGSGLDSATRTSMESALGDKFDDVRIHQDHESDQLNRAISAKAFTTGTDIFLSQQASAGDSHLLAHELTHVVQQRGMSPNSGPMTVGAADSSHEHEASSMASAVTSGSASAGVQRCGAGQEEVARESVDDDELV
jgi:hypothetical protein